MMKRQRGTTSVEFAIVGVLFFMLLFGVMEIGLLLGTWNALDAATQRGARVAAVCPIDHSSIANVAVYGNPSGSGSPLLPGLSCINIQVAYLDASGEPIPDAVSGLRNGCPESKLVLSTSEFDDVRYVRVSIVDYKFPLVLFPLGSQRLSALAFATTIPRESLGVPRAGSGAECFGTSS